MAETNFSAAPKLTSIVALRALKPRNEPYWARLGDTQGAYIGFRKTGPVGDTAGTWRARLWTERPDGSKAQTYATFSKAQDFNEAVKEARAWLAQIEAGVAVNDMDVTVRAACSRYAEKVETTWVGKRPPRPAAAKALRESFARWVDNDRIGNIALTKLKEHHVIDWRDRMAATPIRGGGTRKPSSINRDFATIRAALNFALRSKQVANDGAWLVALADLPGAVQPRTLTLDKQQIRDLMGECEDDLARFVEAMVRLPLRPGAVAQLDVGDFNPLTKTLTVMRDKAGKGRQIKLPTESAAFFARQCTHDGVRRMPNLPMFVRDAVNDEEGPTRWHKDSWKHPLKAAVIAAGLDPKVSAYTLRHSGITAMVLAGVEMARVAYVCGTSVAMIARHYAHLRADDATAALAAIRL